MEANLVASVTILAASFWILSNSFDSYCVQLFHTLLCCALLSVVSCFAIVRWCRECWLPYFNAC